MSELSLYTYNDESVKAFTVTLHDLNPPEIPKGIDLTLRETAKAMGVTQWNLIRDSMVLKDFMFERTLLFQEG